MTKLYFPFFFWLFLILIFIAPLANPETILYTPEFPDNWKMTAENRIIYNDGEFNDTGDSGISAAIYNGENAFSWCNYRIRTLCGMTGFINTLESLWIDILAGTRDKKNTYGIRISRENNRITLVLFKHANNRNEMIVKTASAALKPDTAFLFLLEIGIHADKKGVNLSGRLWFPADNPDKASPFLAITDFDPFSNPCGGVAPFTHGTIGIRSKSLFAHAFWKDLSVSGEKSPGSIVILAPDGVPVVNGQRTTLFGTYRFDGTKDIWEKKMIQLSKMGFNFIHSYQFETRYDENTYIKDVEEFLSLAARYKMGVFLGLPRGLVAGKKKDINKVIYIISELRTEPALWAWYLYDEPADRMIKDLNEVYKKIKELDPFHPVIITHGKMEKLAKNASNCDVLWPDRYDLPYSFIHIRNIVKDIRNKLSKPCWIVSQGHAVNLVHLAREWHYKTNEAAQSIYFAPHTHRPNPKEIRTQFHHAVSLNSPGAIYYWYPDNYYILEEQAPEVWQAFSALGAEVSELSRVINSQDPVPKTEMYFNGNKKQYTDVSVQTIDTALHLKIDINVAPWNKSEASSGFNIRYWVRMLDKRLYIGVVNASYYPLFLVTLHLPFGYKRVYQIPGSRLIIDRSNPRYPFSSLNNGDVIIRDNKKLQGNTQTFSFFLDECSSAVWCFE
ncbi:MAG: hypothetical protein JXB88_03805 [Spirochaetales bacterium]|nr:hypothetical protein [Spirochaetales bacterium]